MSASTSSDYDELENILPAGRRDLVYAPTHHITCRLTGRGLTIHVALSGPPIIQTLPLVSIRKIILASYLGMAYIMRRGASVIGTPAMVLFPVIQTFIYGRHCVSCRSMPPTPVINSPFIIVAFIHHSCVVFMLIKLIMVAASVIICPFIIGATFRQHYGRRLIIVATFTVYS